MVTSLVAGTTRTRIIDWVRPWSAKNLESSSEPRSRTVNAPWDWAAELGEGDGENKRPVGEGDGTLTTWAVAFHAVTAAGMKYAKPPAAAASAIASRAMVSVRKGLSRPREARARCPGLKPSGTGDHLTVGRGLVL